MGVEYNVSYEGVKSRSLKESSAPPRPQIPIECILLEIWSVVVAVKTLDSYQFEL